MQQTPEKSEATVLSNVISSLQDFDADIRERILRTVATFFDISHGVSATYTTPRPSVTRGDVKESSVRVVNFSENMTPSPKQFLFEKQPRSDVERIACLSYYLTHYRGTAHFKTLDLNNINTEAAQPKFSNAAYSSGNASRQGYLAPAARGTKQLSAIGEQFVEALPDREAAKGIMKRARPRRARKLIKKDTIINNNTQ